jgi:hypothetical protein
VNIVGSPIHPPLLLAHAVISFMSEHMKILCQAGLLKAGLIKQ